MSHAGPPRDQRAERGLAPVRRSEPWDRRKARRLGGRWNRRVAAHKERLGASGLQVNVLDGGHDAPLSRRGLEIWHLVVAGVVLLGAVVLSYAYLNR